MKTIKKDLSNNVSSATNYSSVRRVFVVSRVVGHRTCSQVSPLTVNGFRHLHLPKIDAIHVDDLHFQLQYAFGYTALETMALFGKKLSYSAISRNGALN